MHQQWAKILPPHASACTQKHSSCPQVPLNTPARATNEAPLMRKPTTHDNRTHPWARPNKSPEKAQTPNRTRLKTGNTPLKWRSEWLPDNVIGGIASQRNPPMGHAEANQHHSRLSIKALLLLLGPQHAQLSDICITLTPLPHTMPSVTTRERASR